MAAIKNQSELNREIEELIKNKDASKQTYSEEDKAFVSQYVGSGGESTTGKTGEGILYEFYTPTYIVELMWELAYHFGFEGGQVLEPACGTGRFFSHAPKESKLTGFETNPISARIAQILYPVAEIHNFYFENAFMIQPRYVSRIKEGLTWLSGYPFDLIIGNPPYGRYRNFFSSYFTWPKVIQNELFFMYYGLKMLKKGGLLVYIIPDRFMRNGATYSQMKKEMGWICKLLDAYHLPPVFPKTSISTDIIVLQRT
ncbi:N-6 DNA methylase [Fulvivirga sp. 29W222]|uniref:site-specific DNA-methyltransferase (adenine-specific) n=1 Tax=Fulvivirga marina TaxID=2494733 RepID=A0A937FW52_9BACT|nr:N-6 DNA methylase [Fulvivirga marina]MBL6445692.1 N-6 DNA methylase [Fulvivirga marina]